MIILFYQNQRVFLKKIILFVFINWRYNTKLDIISGLRLCSCLTIVNMSTSSSCCSCCMALYTAQNTPHPVAPSLKWTFSLLNVCYTLYSLYTIHPRNGWTNDSYHFCFKNITWIIRSFYALGPHFLHVLQISQHLTGHQHCLASCLSCPMWLLRRYLQCANHHSSERK